MTDLSVGLASREACKLLKQIGPNGIADVAQHPLLRALNKLWAPVPWMLEAAIVLQLGLGECVEAAVVSLLVHKVVQVLFLGAGLVMTGHAVLTPTLMVLMMLTGDSLAMSSSTDNVRPSPKPTRWRIRNLTIAGIIMGAVDLMFCVACLATGKFLLNLDTDTLRTLTVITLVFSGQAVFYVARERQHLWSSFPGQWLIVCSVADLALIVGLAINGFMMAAIPIGILIGGARRSHRLCVCVGCGEVGSISAPCRSMSSSLGGC